MKNPEIKVTGKKEGGYMITGIADEAAEDIKTQLEVHRILGWNSIELRTIDGENVSTMSDEKFEEVYAAIAESGFKVVAFSSPIANWSRPITTDFEIDLNDLKRSIPRMKRLKTRYIRIMSYPNDGLSEGEWKREAIRRIRILTDIAYNEGIVLVHENCHGWASESPENLAELIERIDSPALRIVFDSGNPIALGGSREDTWRFYEAAKPYIVHFHVKDCFDDKKTESGEALHTFPGEGAADLRRIISDLLKSGYSGAFSIEPHIAVQIHLGSKLSEHPEARETYLEYGRRTNRLFKELDAEPGQT